MKFRGFFLEFCIWEGKSSQRLSFLLEFCPWDVLDDLSIYLLSIFYTTHKRESRKFKSHGLKAIGCLEEQMRAQWIDFFMVCNMATKNSGFPEKPVEKIRFEIFKKLSCLHFLAKFNEFWILYSSCKDVRKSLLAFFCTGTSGSGNSVFVFMHYCALFRAPL